MNIQICGGPKSLNEGDRTAGGCAAFDVCLFDKKSGDDAMNDLQYRRQQFGMHGEQTAQRYRERQHPLSHRHARDDLIHQIRSGFRHAPRAARGADAAQLAAKGDQQLVRATLTAQAHEAVREYAACEIGIELVFDELGQACYFDCERLIVLLHQPIEWRLFGAAALVAGRLCGRCAQERGTHEGVEGSFRML